MRESLKEYCLRHGRNELLEQWHSEKNGYLTPENVSYGSKKKIWWMCEFGHEWQSPPFSRAGGHSGCPYCAGKRIASSVSLKSVYPDIAAQWHPNKNGKLVPEQVLPDSYTVVWWQCKKGHEWRAMVKTRVVGNGCPICTNSVVISGKNDLESHYPSLAQEWHPNKNGALKPSQISFDSKRKVWWQCKEGHEWQSAIYTRVRGNGCPICSGKLIVPGKNDLKSNFPELISEWNYEKNGSISPDRVSVNSNQRVWWKCKLGHEWLSSISSRAADKNRCPYCSGHKVLKGFNDLITTHPLVAAEWHPYLNEGLTPSMVTAMSAKIVWWRCEHGHEWKAAINTRTSAPKGFCPICAGLPTRKNRRFI